MKIVAKKNVSFKPDGPRFPNIDLKQKSNVSFFKDKNDMKNINH